MKAIIIVDASVEAGQINLRNALRTAKAESELPQGVRRIFDRCFEIDIATAHSFFLLFVSSCIARKLPVAVVLSEGQVFSELVPPHDGFA
jgi:hypothetical protein